LNKGAIKAPVQQSVGRVEGPSSVRLLLRSTLNKGAIKAPVQQRLAKEAIKAPAQYVRATIALLQAKRALKALALLTLPPLERVQAKAQEATQIGEILKMVSLRKIVRKLTLPPTSLRSISTTVVMIRDLITKRTLTFRLLA
jgi:hypothetical protein